MKNDCRVGVVGAGLAGISAARRLEADGAAVTVFECEDHVGGRTRTHRVEGTQVNVGAQYVGGQDTPVAQLCRELGLDLYPLGGSQLAVHIGERLASAQNSMGLGLRMPLSLRERTQLARTAWRLGRWRRRLENSDERREAMHRLDAIALDHFLADTGSTVRELFRSMVVRMTAGEPEDVSAYLAIEWTPASGLLGSGVKDDFDDYFAVRAGTSAIAEGLAAQLKAPVRVGTTVTAVHGDEHTVTLSTDNGSSHDFDAVVLATPAGTAPEIDLPGASGLRASLREVNYGAYLTVALQGRMIPASPWAKTFSVQCADGPFHVLTNQDWGLPSADQGHWIVAVSGGLRAEGLMGQPDEVIADQALKLTCEVSGSFDLMSDPVVTRWPHGLPYWHPSKIQTGRRPIRHGRLFLAGDHMDYPNMQGAVRSGQYAADQISNQLITPSEEQ